MKNALLAIAGIGIVLSVLAFTTTEAQIFAPEPTPAPTATEATPTAAKVTEPIVTTPEIWFYQEQMRRYDDPKTMVRQRAEFRAAQRRNRLAASQWFGYNNLRPTANPVPFMYQYTTTWSGNSSYLNNWSSGRASSPVIYLSRPPVQIQR